MRTNYSRVRFVRWQGQGAQGSMTSPVITASIIAYPIVLLFWKYWVGISFLPSQPTILPVHCWGGK